MPAAHAQAAAAGGDTRFESSGFDNELHGDGARPWVGWRRPALALAALLGCLLVFSLARWLAAAPQIDGAWAAGAGGELVLLDPRARAPALQRGHTVVGLERNGAEPLAVDALALHRWPRWQPDTAVRARQVMQHEGLARQRAAAAGGVQLQSDDGSSLRVPVAARGYTGLGWLFWPLAALALALYLFAVVLILAQPRPLHLLFVLMALCQAGNLLLSAVASAGGLGLPAGLAAADLPWRVALDLATAAAAVQLFALHPRRLPGAQLPALAAWALLPAWGLAVALGSDLPLWWLAQGACLALALLALLLARRSHRIEPNPYALVMQGLAASALGALLLVTAAVLLGAQYPAKAAAVAGGAAVIWQLFLASLLLLTPLLTRRRHVLREFALLAGASTVATALDLLFVAVFSLGAFTSLALAVFIGVGLYAAARQWLLNHLIGSTVLTTERTFESLYRAARALQAQPQRFPQLLAGLLGELFEPLELQRIDRAPPRARVVGGGAGLVVPMREADDAARGGSPAALRLRFARHGQRLFTTEDARLADRMVEQLRRAVAYDAAVERGRFEERQRIAQDLHDDIGARLLTLMYQAPTREMEDYIRHTLLDLKTLTRGLAAAELRFSHAAAEWKADITHRLTVAQVGLGWSFQIDRDRLLTVVQWSALTRVLRELVSNALYHGHATQIDISLRLQGALLTLQVADDGSGRAPQDWAHGLGLGGVRKRVKLLGGEVQWRENGGLGIVCDVRVPEFVPRV